MLVHGPLGVHPVCWALRRIVPAVRVGATSGLAGLVAALATGYAALFIALSPLALEDFPTHLARAIVIDDLALHGGERFGSVYSYHFLAIPYVLGDLMLTALVELLGPNVAGALWVALVFLSLPCAVLLYATATRVSLYGRGALVLLSLYLATDWFFAAGFLNYRLGIAMTLATLAIVHTLRERWTYSLYLLYVILVALDYLMHLSTVAFLCAAVAPIALLRLARRSSRVRTELLIALPLAAVLIWNGLVADAYRRPTDLIENAYIWGTPARKLAGLAWEFFRYRRGGDLLLLLLLGACAALWLHGASRERLRRPAVLEPLVVSAGFLALYWALPRGYSDAWFVDIRALPLAALFLLFACVALADETAAGPVSEPSATWHRRWALIAAAVLVTLNLLGLASPLHREAVHLAHYRSIVASVPWHARVFPVYARSTGDLGPLLHANSFVTIDRSGIVPYEFAGDNGNTVRYFRYMQRPYDPDEQWYAAYPAIPVSWPTVACTYRYILISVPYDAHRIGVPTRTVVINDTAALLRIDPTACSTASAAARRFPLARPAPAR